MVPPRSGDQIFLCLCKSDAGKISSSWIVPTQSILPVFNGDEIDASMDRDWTANSAAPLQTLKSRTGQMLIVMHKRPEAAHVIEDGGVPLGQGGADSGPSLRKT